MNINPFSSTVPHYDSYDDFYKFFEVYPKEVSEVTPIGVFPLPIPKPVEPAEKQVGGRRKRKLVKCQ